MRLGILSVTVSMLLLSCGSSTADRDQIFKLEQFEADSTDFNYLPKSGYVDKPEVAVGIAEAVAMRFYGRSEIEKQRPYLVKRLHDRWVVRGSFPYPQGTKGGVFAVEVSSTDGKILRLLHGK